MLVTETRSRIREDRFPFLVDGTQKLSPVALILQDFHRQSFPLVVPLQHGHLFGLTNHQTNQPVPPSPPRDRAMKGPTASEGHHGKSARITDFALVFCSRTNTWLANLDQLKCLDSSC